MKRALIATVYNESANLVRWWRTLMQQTVMPDEIVIVDGGSNDGTWEQLQSLTRESPVPLKLEQRRCNIAEGRNRAIELTDAEIIASTDAGSFPEPEWFAEITGPLMEDEVLELTGGLSIVSTDSSFQRFLAKFEATQLNGISPGQLNPSSRNTAFRRRAWAAVGGYPEWLTLAGEDALFTLQLNRIGRTRYYNPKAIVHWEFRESASAYFKLLYRNGYGAAEAGFAGGNFLRQALIVIFPPLLLLSIHRFRYLKFRYLRNYCNARGWIEGYLKGHRPPPDWRRMDGLLLSPEAQRCLPPTHP
ncbi:MAG: glycosyltransferase [Chthoniobacter sp.]